MVKNLLVSTRDARDESLIPGSSLSSLEKEMALVTPVFLPGEFHGQRSLVDYSPWGCERVGHDLATEQQQICALHCWGHC